MIHELTRRTYIQEMLSLSVVVFSGVVRVVLLLLENSRNILQLKTKTTTDELKSAYHE